MEIFQILQEFYFMKNMAFEDKEYKNALSVLNFLRKCFPEENYQFLSKHAWVFSVYTMIRDLNMGYALKGKEELIREFIKDFHSKVYSEDFRRSNQNYSRFYDNVRGGWSEKLIVLRRDILKTISFSDQPPLTLS